MQVYTLVLIRHGESQWNIENRFTGWVDVPLAPSGVEESHRAAKSIKEEGLEFDSNGGLLPPRIPVSSRHSPRHFYAWNIP